MAPWEIGAVSWQRGGNPPPPTWTTDDLTITVGLSLALRGSFSIANGDEAINLGTLQPQRYVDGAWVDFSNEWRNVAPGHGMIAPTWMGWTWTFESADWTPDIVYPTRLKVEWDGGPYYSDALPPQTDSLDVSVVPVALGGILDEFLEDWGLATIAGVGEIPAVFADPYRESLKVEGVRPFVLVESARVPAIVHGVGVTIPGDGRAFRVKSIRPSSASGLSELLLEEL